MFKYFICLVLALNAAKASAQTISYVVDSIMNEYMVSGYANEHFMPKGEYDKYKLRTGKWKDYTVEETMSWCMKNGIPTSLHGSYLVYGEGKFEHDLREGTWELYLLEDKTFKKIHLRTLNFVNGKVDGVRTDFFPSGKIAYKGAIDVGLFVGEHALYYENGDKCDVGSYTKNNRTGLHSTYFIGGALKSTRYYTNDTLNGTYTCYYQNGKIEWTADYKNGVGDGLYRYYYQSGQLWTEKLYKEDKVLEVNGTYSMNGTKLDHGTITNGNGTIISYTLNGKVYQIATLKDGVEISKEVLSEFD